MDYNSSNPDIGIIQVSEQGPENIQWVITDNSENCRAMLNVMYNSLQDNSDLKVFLENRCSHLLKLPVGDTGYPVDFFNHDKFMSSYPNPVPLPDSNNANTVGDFAGKSGTYTIYCPDTQEHYIGANMEFSLRLKQHYHDYSRVVRQLYARINELGINRFVWQPTVVTPHYYIEYVRDHLDMGADYQVYRILTDFVKYETRMFEQAFKSHVEPALNGPGDISFPVKWDPLETRDTFYSRPFVAVTTDGLEKPFSSMNYGSQILGTSRKTIETVINYNTYVDCKGIGAKCRFFEVGRAIREGSPYANPYTVPDHTSVDYNSLPLGRVIAFNEKLEEYASFADSTEAAAACGYGDDYYRISRYINKKFIKVLLGGVTLKLLFTQNPMSKGRTKQVVRTDVTGEVIGYESINACRQDLGLKGDSSYFIKKHIKRDHVYDNRYTFCYLSDYKGSTLTMRIMD